MTTSTRAVVLALAAVLGAAAGLARAELPMGESVEYPHAGLAVAMPEDYQTLTVAQPFDISRAILSDKGQPVQAVTVAALPLEDPSVSAEELADAIITTQEQNLAIRNLQVLSKAAMKVADQPGAARFISYNFRGEQTVAASVVFCRTLSPGQRRLQYVITVEAIADRKAEVLPALGEVVKSIRLLTVVRPIDIPLKASGRIVEGPGGTYALPVPHGWFAQTSEAGVSLAQTDYVRGGEPALSACVLVADASPGETLQQHAEQCIAAAKRNASEEGMETEVLSDGPSKLGSAEAHQLVFEERLPRAASAPAMAASQPATAMTGLPIHEANPTSAAASTEPTTSTAPAVVEEIAAAEPNNVVIVQRSVLLSPAEAGGPVRRMTLALVCVDAKPPACVQVFDKLSEGMVLRAAAATAPAATQPASAPATAPTTRRARAK